MENILYLVYIIYICTIFLLFPWYRLWEENTYYCVYWAIIYLLLPGILKDKEQYQQGLVEHNPGNLTPSQVPVYQCICELLSSVTSYQNDVQMSNWIKEENDFIEEINLVSWLYNVKRQSLNNYKFDYFANMSKTIS